MISEEIKDRIDETVRVMVLAKSLNDILNSYHEKEIDEDVTLELWDSEIEAFLEQSGRYE
jgi:hypothetical protein